MAESEAKRPEETKGSSSLDPPSARLKEVSFTVAMIFDNGASLTAYCDATKQNKNLISLQ